MAAVKANATIQPALPAGNAKTPVPKPTKTRIALGATKKIAITVVLTERAIHHKVARMNALQAKLVATVPISKPVETMTMIPAQNGETIHIATTAVPTATA